MVNTFWVTFKHSSEGRFRAVTGTMASTYNVVWYKCPTIAECAVARFLQKNMPGVEDIKSAKVTIEFD